jgi:hypothetical protein
MVKEGHIDDDVLWCPCCLRLLPLAGMGRVRLQSDVDRKTGKFYGGDALASTDTSGPPPTQSEVDSVPGVSWGRDGCPWSAAFALMCRVGAPQLMTAED